MRFTLHRSVTTSLRVTFTQHARDLDDPINDSPLFVVIPKERWREMGHPEQVTVEVPS